MKKTGLLIIALAFIVLAFIFDRPYDIFLGYKEIILSSSILITDYLSFSIGAAFFNAGSLLLIYLIFIKLLDIRISGPVFAGLLAILGFSFFGKNIINTIPISLGVYLYSLYSKTPFKNTIITFLFSSGMAPCVSYLMFGLSISLLFSIPIAIIVGILIGFIIVPLASHTLKFHNGYNLYNVGFAMGIISIVFYGILLAFNIDIISVNSSTNEYHYYLLSVIIGLVVLFLIMSLIKDKKAIFEYKKLLSKSGRLITDFTRDFNESLILINVAFMGILCILIVFGLNIKLDGLNFGAILLVMGFSAFGVHPKNSIPVLIGAILGFIIVYLVTGNKLGYSGIFFVVGLAPISSKYGIFFGIVAGFIHMMILPICLDFQGGFDLYNNGFAAGFVASVLTPILDNLRREE